MNAPTEAEKLKEIYAKQNGLLYSGPASLDDETQVQVEPTLAPDQAAFGPEAQAQPQNPWMHSAISYVVKGNGVHAFPCKRGTKEPASRWPWTKRKLTETELPKYFGNADTACNIGIALGDASGGLTDLDFDWPYAYAFADILFANCPAFGRQSKLRSHRIVYCFDLGAGRVTFELPAVAKGHALLPLKHAVCIAEIRSTGHYTVFPHGVHTSGELIEMHQAGSPPTLEATELKRRMGLLAFCTLAAQMFPPVGLRQTI